MVRLGPVLCRKFSRLDLWRLSGADEKAVFEQAVPCLEEAIALYHTDGKPLPLATSGKDYANKMQNVA